MGRFYTRKKGSLYIYVIGKEELIEPNAFPEELNLFGAESAWRLNNWMAISREVQEEKMDRAERILRMNGFNAKSLEEQVLEEYFRSGDESLIKGRGLASKLRGGLPALLGMEEMLPEPAMMQETGAPSVAKPEKVSLSTEEADLPPERGQTAVQVPRNEAELIRYLLAYVKKKGFTYPEWLVKNYYICLKTKPFVILTGFSGMGKTALTKLMAEALTGSRSDRYLRVAIQPGWLDDEKILGFYNASTERYISTPFLNFLLEASKTPDEPFFVCLDEMNLSRIEHYLSRFLSAMESMDREVTLHPIKNGVETEDGQLIPATIRVPRNLFITGTIDVDKSSPLLSSSFLDCVNLIEFMEADLGERYKEETFENRMALDMETLTRFRRKLRTRAEEEIVKTLFEINQIIKGQGFPISFRVRNEILAYVANSQGIYSQNSAENLRMALDLQIKQRVLTKIGGTETLLPTLERFHGFLEDRFPISAEKTEKMKERLGEAGFTNFSL